MRFKKKNKICHWSRPCRDCTSHVRNMCDHTGEIPSPDTGYGQIVASMRGRMCVPGWITGLGMRGRWMEIRDSGEDSENAKKRITFRVRHLRTRKVMRVLAFSTYQCAFSLFHFPFDGVDTIATQLHLPPARPTSASCHST